MTAPAEPSRNRPAGIVTRALSAVIDGLVVLAIVVCCYLGVVCIRLMASPRGFRFPEPQTWLSLGAGLVVSFAYLTICTATTGRSLGGAVMGLRVIGPRRVLMRWPVAAVRAALCVLFPWGLVWVALDRRRRSLQDIALHTRVIYDWHDDPELVGERVES